MDLADLRRIAAAEAAARTPVRVHCCTSTGCRASGALAVKAAVEKAAADRGLADEVQVVGVGCPGLCSRGPIVEVTTDGAMYERVTPADADDVVGTRTGGWTRTTRSLPAK